MNKQLKFRPRKIHWYEGMPLSPHHFQQSDLLYTETLSYLFSKLMPYHWGIVDIDLDTSDIKDGIIRINNLEAILEDKSIITLPQNKDDKPTIDLTQEFKDNIQNRKIKIFLTKPNSNYTYESEYHNKGYNIVQMDHVEDFNNGNNSTCLFKLESEYKITFDEIPFNYTGIQLCTAYEGALGIQLEEYDPPSIYLKNTHYLLQKCKKLIQELKDKTIHIKKQININNNQFNSSTLNSILLQGILPAEHLLNSEQAHPIKLFSSLINLLGHISIFSQDFIFPDAPQYDHKQILASFNPILTLIKNIINTIKQPYILHKFEEHDGGFYQKVEEKHLAGQDIFILISYSNMEKDEIKNWIKQCIIASKNMLDDAVEKRVLGINREIDTMENNNISQLILKFNANDTFFKLNEELCILNPSSKEKPISIALIEFIT
ncbi:MAG: type VI secretion system baseplate subunit TssK [Alphaproteobacteria bacterium]|nr:MAG: type VI secretion system baseplate subunit TssK [Alphaproteobacteria bacterium]